MSRAKNPRTIAAKAVTEWLDVAADEFEMEFDQSPIEAAVLEINELLKRESPARDDDDAESRCAHYEGIAQRAGYIVGVQVGLRLRGGR